MTRVMTTYERMEADPVHRPGLRKEELILAVTCAISEEIERQQITKADLAAKLKTSRANVTMLLSGGRNLTLASIAEMADALGCKVEMQLVPRKTSTRASSPRTVKAKKAARTSKR